MTFPLEVPFDHLAALVPDYVPSGDSQLDPTLLTARFRYRPAWDLTGIRPLSPEQYADLVLLSGERRRDEIAYLTALQDALRPGPAR